MKTLLPEYPQRPREPQAVLGFASLAEPFQRGAQVILLDSQLLHPWISFRPPVPGPWLRLLSQFQEVGGVLLPHGIGLTTLRQPLQRVVADRLQ